MEAVLHFVSEDIRAAKESLQIEFSDISVSFFFFFFFTCQERWRALEFYFVRCPAGLHSDNRPDVVEYTIEQIESLDWALSWFKARWKSTKEV